MVSSFKDIFALSHANSCIQRCRLWSGGKIPSPKDPCKEINASMDGSAFIGRYDLLKKLTANEFNDSSLGHVKFEMTVQSINTAD